MELKLLQKELFENPDFDPQRYAQDMEKPAAPRRFVIYFTPRSGSSWLEDTLTDSKCLGRPSEYFNPNFIPNIARSINADSLERYIDVLTRRNHPGRIFSFEITIYHLNRVFGNGEAFLKFFPPSLPAFYLRREDMVLQAVSLAKAVTTSVYHSKNAQPQDINEADTAFGYDPDLIGQWLAHILDQERKIEAYFEKFDLRPHRLSYEQIMEMGQEATVRHFIRHLRPKMHQQGRPANLTFSSRHAKIGTSRNAEYAERFRQDRPDRAAEVDEFRASLAGTTAG